jgi:hypothetical protein
MAEQQSQDQQTMPEFDFGEGPLPSFFISNINWSQTDDESVIPPESTCRYDKCVTEDTALEKGSAWKANRFARVSLQGSDMYVHDRCLTAAHDAENAFIEDQFKIASGGRTGTIVSGPDVPQDGQTHLIEVPVGELSVAEMEAMASLFPEFIIVHPDRGGSERPDDAETGA